MIANRYSGEKTKKTKKRRRREKLWVCRAGCIIRLVGMLMGYTDERKSIESQCNWIEVQNQLNWIFSARGQKMGDIVGVGGHPPCHWGQVDDCDATVGWNAGFGVGTTFHPIQLRWLFSSHFAPKKPPTLPHSITTPIHTTLNSNQVEYYPIIIALTTVGEELWCRNVFFEPNFNISAHVCGL